MPENEVETIKRELRAWDNFPSDQGLLAWVARRSKDLTDAERQELKTWMEARAGQWLFAARRGWPTEGFERLF